jgi:hypothetical protein
MLKLLAQLLPPRTPPAPPPEPPLEIVVTAARVLFCIALMLCARVMRVLSALRAAERAHAELARRRQIASDALTLGTGGVVCWKESPESGSESSAVGSEAEESVSTPEQQAEQQPGHKMAPAKLCAELQPPAVADLAFVRRLASKAHPWCVRPARPRAPCARALAPSCCR